ncbi:pyridoxine biosynthesis protein [Vanrija albida]|uniref:Pyridoxine biosynthesis protein n=1 Tax=Vanrija albida TaxID=181172 RepID=A0ABR3PTQ0_9TREE
MRAAYSIARVSRAALARPSYASARFASTLFKMPAMSPTMTEGGIADWKKAEGEAFAAGDVLLEIETDKATIDVEAQDEGVLGKILSPAGSKNIPVGQVIAVLAEEGDDLSKLEVPSDVSAHAPEIPKEDEAPAAAPAKAAEPAPASTETAKPVHKEVDSALPLFPSASRLLIESNLTPEQISKIKGTGLHGRITKGDVLAAEGKVKNPFGSAEKLVTDPIGPSGLRASEPKRTAGAGAAAAPAKAEPPLDGPALRRLIVQGLNKATAPVAPVAAPTSAKVTDADFDDVLADYGSLVPRPAAPAPAAADAAAPAAAKHEYDALF